MIEIFGYIFVLYIIGLNGLIQNVVILLVHNFYKSTHLGGEDHVFREEVESLRKSQGAGQVLVYEVHNDRASMVEIVFHLLFPFVHALRIRKIVHKNKVDVVHLHNDFPMLTLWVFRFLRSANCVRIQTLHNYRHWCSNGILFAKKEGTCHRCIDQKSRLPSIRLKCYRNSFLQSTLVAFAYWVQNIFQVREDVDAFFCLSEHQKKLLLSFDVKPQKLILKPNGVLDEKIPSQVSSVKDIEMIYVGRIEESKGIFKLLDGLDSVTRGKIVVVGFADNLEILRKKYPEVKFLGKKSHPETMELIERSRFLLHPSICYETFGLTMIEAMSLGTPVLGFPIGTRLDFIQHGVNGFLIDENNIQRDVEYALGVNTYSSLQKNAFNFSKSFSKDLVMKKQIAIYRDLLERKKVKQLA